MISMGIHGQKQQAAISISASLGHHMVMVSILVTNSDPIAKISTLLRQSNLAREGAQTTSGWTG
jgi:hypothetical protein